VAIRPQGTGCLVLLSPFESGTVTRRNAPSLRSENPMNGLYFIAFRSPVKPLRTVMAALSLIAIVGCASRLEFPPMGEPLPVSVKLEIPAAIKELRADYTDGCGHLMQVPLGTQLEEALVEGAYRTFKSVSYEEAEAKMRRRRLSCASIW
jgi:hypothetical protein